MATTQIDLFGGNFTLCKIFRDKKTGAPTIDIGPRPYQLYYSRIDKSSRLENPIGKVRKKGKVKCGHY
jgi:hypothetical protein